MIIWLKRKHAFFLFFLSGSDRRFDNTIANCFLGATRTSLDEELISPFHPVAALSRLTVSRNIKGYEMELQTKTTGLWQTSKRNWPLWKLWIPNEDKYMQETINVF